MKYNVVHIQGDTDELLDKCVREFIRLHPEFEKIKISRNKIIYEVCKWYLKS